MNINDDGKQGAIVTIVKCNNRSVKLLESRNAVLCLQQPLKESLNGGGINQFVLKLYRELFAFCTRSRQISLRFSLKCINLQNINLRATG